MLPDVFVYLLKRAEWLKIGQPGQRSCKSHFLLKLDNFIVANLHSENVIQFSVYIEGGPTFQNYISIHPESYGVNFFKTHCLISGLPFLGLISYFALSTFKISLFMTFNFVYLLAFPIFKGFPAHCSFIKRSSFQTLFVSRWLYIKCGDVSNQIGFSHLFIWIYVFELLRTNGYEVVQLDLRGREMDF